MSRVFGWEPPSQQGREDVVCPGSGQGFITFSIDPDSSTGYSPSPTSKIEEAVLRDPPRKGDPDYVPRPPNSFFVFRKEYSRLNARGPKANRSRRKSSDIKGKGLSRRAGDAWKALPQSEIDYWQARAAEEKVMHARAHPAYRYQPKKCKSVRGKCIPKVAMAPAPSSSKHRSPSGAGIKNNLQSSKPRSSSVPTHVSTPSFLLRGEERVAGPLRRARSHALDIQPPLPAPSEAESLSFGRYEYPGTVNFSHGSEHQKYLLETQQPPFVSGYGSEPSIDTRTLPAEYPLFTTGLSSLAGWNGEPIAPSLARIPSSTLLTSPLSSWSASSPYNSYHEGYQYNQSDEQYAEFRMPGVNHFGIHESAPAVYWCPQAEHEPRYDLEGGYDSSSSYRNEFMMQENALTNFDLGLANEVSAPGNFMPFDMPYLDEQRVFNEYHNTQF
ncbi:hypothetical protein F5876DRAFT_61032 [Lentinula aff. lateritia]|uniref:Uncharacterized protein n=1 Tax=Lentinula aff. lateritia TaxID=2804960 RepID=A0ACC1UFR9_9AGAR|nr:hypothetical protein F5876DRAFT_61032 [Lentinula aff. lateritia]